MSEETKSPAILKLECAAKAFAGLESLNSNRYVTGRPLDVGTDCWGPELWGAFVGRGFLHGSGTRYEAFCEAMGTSEIDAAENVIIKLRSKAVMLSADVFELGIKYDKLIARLVDIYNDGKPPIAPK